MDFLRIIIEIISIIVFSAALFILIKRTYAVLKKNSSEEKQYNLYENNDALYIKLALTAVLSRILIYVFAYFSIMLLQDKSEGFFYTFKALWNRWDAIHYIDIAQNWYLTENDSRFLIVFFPFYPISIKIVNFFIKDYFASGIFVSNVSLMVCCVYLFKLTKLDYEKEVSFNSIKYLLIFPVSFFLGATFSESLFLALTIMTLFYARIGKWFLACILGMLSAFTRSLGILITIPLLVEFMIQTNSIEFSQGKFINIGRCFVKKGIFILLIPCGLFGYLYINKLVWNDWFKFLEFQSKHWNQNFGLFYKNIGSYFTLVFQGNWNPSLIASLWGPQLFIVIAAIGIMVYSALKLRLSYSIYLYIGLIVSISPTWLLSGPRYIMGLFPVYIALAVLSRNKLYDNLITIVSVAMLIYCTIAFVTGRHIM